MKSMFIIFKNQNYQTKKRKLFKNFTIALLFGVKN
jgi:hypothetical protein